MGYVWMVVSCEVTVQGSGRVRGQRVRSKVRGQGQGQRSLTCCICVELGSESQFWTKIITRFLIELRPVGRSSILYHWDTKTEEGAEKKYAFPTFQLSFKCTYPQVSHSSNNKDMSKIKNEVQSGFGPKFKISILDPYPGWPPPPNLRVVGCSVAPVCSAVSATCLVYCI